MRSKCSRRGPLSAALCVLLLGPGLGGCRRDSARAAKVAVSESAEPAGYLTFISERSGNRDVFLIRADGRDEVRLTDGPAAEYNGPATPDQTRLLITSAEGEQQWFSLLPLPSAGAMTTAAADAAQGSVGKAPVNRAIATAVPLGPRRASLLSPRFSPDGERLYFESESSGYHDLFCLRLSDGAVTQLTDNPEGNFAPALSPDGAELALVSSRDRVAELYLLPARGGPARRLTTTGRDEWLPEWSPRGGWLVFGSDREGADRLYLLPTADEPHEKSITGDGARRVTSRGLQTDTVEQQPAFSPDGRRLAYIVRRRGQPSRIEIVELDAALRPGRLLEVSTPPDGDASDPEWSPDGRFLAFSFGRGSRSQIYRVGADGQGLLPVTNHPSVNWHPRWLKALPAHPATTQPRP